MKNAMKYYYDLIVDSICQKNTDYYLRINNQFYMLVKVNENIDTCVELSKYYAYSHEFIYNLNKKLVTNINDINYVLLRIKINDRMINIYDVINFTNSTLINNYLIRKLNWNELWVNKIDNLEYQMGQFGKKYPLIRESFSYYNGLTENAIQLFNTIVSNRIPMCISHKRVNKNDTLINHCNPLNYIVDCNIRDACEYFKDCFIDNYNNCNDLYTYISKLNEIELLYFFNRMMYPSFYFDCVENIIFNNEDEKKLKSIISLVNEYELMLRKIYEIVRTKTRIDIIEWIIKT